MILLTPRSPKQWTIATHKQCTVRGSSRVFCPCLWPLKVP